MKSNQKHPRCIKRGGQELKTGLTENNAKSNGPPRLPGFDSFETFGHDDLIAKHCDFRCSRPPDVDGIKIFDKDDQAAKHLFFSFNGLQPSHLYQKF